MVARNRVFATDLVTTRRFGKKPGFSRLWVGGQKPGFSQDICDSLGFGKKPGFFDFGCEWVARNRVFRRIFVTA